MYRLPIVSIFFAILLAVFSYPAVSELLKPGYFTNHDGEGHIIRLAEFDLAIRDGQIPPRLSKNLMYGYGFYFFNFNYPLVYILGVLFHSVGLDYIQSINMLSVFSLVLSGIAMFWWQKSYWGNLGGFIAGVFYMYAPYRFLNMYVRGSVAEHLAFVMLPLLFMFTEKIVEGDKKQRFGYTVWGGICYALLFLSHNITAFIFSLMLGLFVIFHIIFYKKFHLIWNYFLMGVIGLSLSAYFWIPSILEKGFVRLDQTIGRDYPDHFLYLPQLWQNFWGFGGSGKGANDGLSFQLGNWHILFLIISVFSAIYLWKRSHARALHILFYLFVFLLSVFFMLPTSRVLWEKMPLLAFTQFPWRFLSWSVFVISILAGASVYVVSQYLRRIHRMVSVVFVLIVTIGVLFYSKQFVRVNHRIDIRYPTDSSIPGSTTWADEQFPIWFEPKPVDFPPAKVTVIQGQGDITIDKWQTGRHVYQIDAKTSLYLVEHTAYYPGWTIYVDGVLEQYEYMNGTYPGRFVFTVTPGKHTVTTVFRETPLRKISDIISLTTVALLILVGVYNKLLVKNPFFRRLR